MMRTGVQRGREGPAQCPATHRRSHEPLTGRVLRCAGCRVQHKAFMRMARQLKASAAAHAFLTALPTQQQLVTTFTMALDVSCACAHAHMHTLPARWR